MKFGVYNNFGLKKDVLKDLLMFYSSDEKKLVTLGEYVKRMKEGQSDIYYAAGETYDKIDKLPQVEKAKEKYEILYLKDAVDEFVPAYSRPVTRKRNSSPLRRLISRPLRKKSRRRSKKRARTIRTCSSFSRKS